MKTHECIWPSTHAPISFWIFSLPTQVRWARPQHGRERVLTAECLWSVWCGLERLEWGQWLAAPHNCSTGQLGGSKYGQPQISRHNRLGCLDRTDKIPPVIHSGLGNMLPICDANSSWQKEGNRGEKWKSERSKTKEGKYVRSQPYQSRNRRCCLLRRNWDEGFVFPKTVIFREIWLMTPWMRPSVLIVSLRRREEATNVCYSFLTSPFNCFLI